jgi:hypothetical protein
MAGDSYELLGLNEADAIETIAASLGTRARTRVLAEVSSGGRSYPIRAVVFGRTEPEAPTLALFGGVHGLEKIGCEVVLAYLGSFAQYASWDRATAELLERMRIAFVPLVNPVGLLRGTRCNGNGVDLMRNAPVDSPERVSRLLLFRGHRISPRLPWYRGALGAPMEPEARAIVDFVREEVLGARVSLCVDVHSGFGAVDRLWFPYAGRRALIPDVADAYGLKTLLDRTLPNHVYAVEPQSCQYTTHGDLWDYLYELHLSERRDPDSLFLPLTLEMGSWNWLKKNPFHAYRAAALFHPIKAHRIRRVLRRHAGLFDFLARAALNDGSWRVGSDPSLRAELERRAGALWG